LVITISCKGQPLLPLFNSDGAYPDSPAVKSLAKLLRPDYDPTKDKDKPRKKNQEANYTNGTTLDTLDQMAELPTTFFPV